VTIRPDVVRARLLAALEADLVGPFAAGVPGADPAEVAASDETLTLPPSRCSRRAHLTAGECT